MKVLTTSVSVLLSVALTFSAVWAADHGAPGIAPADALKLLQDGNARFVAGTLQHPRSNVDRAKETAEHGQHPFATIVACSDSRVPLEVIFDQGIGDIFAIKAAGNVNGDAQIGSVEYGVAHAGSKLVVVLGHTNCGAVTAACTGGGHEGYIETLMKEIYPAVRVTQAITGKNGKEIIEPACRANVFLQIEELKQKSDILREAIEKGGVEIVGGVYDIKTGKVEFFETTTKTVEAAIKAGTSKVDAAPRQSADVVRQSQRRLGFRVNR